MQVIYIEKQIKHHPRVQSILSKVGRKSILIECDNYREVFNPKSQNFRIQKQRPALILAEKTGSLVIPTPEGFGIGGNKNYYFSHMLNCIYDCRYCFLQGLYRSAHYVVFVNFEDYMMEIVQKLEANHNATTYFFSGYDCDSLALDPVTDFINNFVPFFAQHPQAILELRTKSDNNKSLLALSAIPNVIVAFSFTPEVISQKVEHKVPPLKKRLQAMKQLVEAGWQIGLRLDPLIYADDFALIYPELIDLIFQYVSADAIHSVSIGPLRFPQKMYQHIVKLYPHDQLLAHPLQKRDQQYSYAETIEMKMKQSIISSLQHHVPQSLVFECQSAIPAKS